eukprot:gnl/TRDRNA2_/TRDRNA2_51773_c0_seq1.p1 gnl/TRDRNA2_/TRDRNA2_51773_c0~~gnl/TRDRNA2_/TRDRNA2_51773_c0_seq1.p1  ORF type:complete len:310 (+),score=19.36 gnl/TRDRNA2_/TRDRNA2_51773_c0_seq1:234-1163(+)
MFRRPVIIVLSRARIQILASRLPRRGLTSLPKAIIHQLETGQARQTATDGVSGEAEASSSKSHLDKQYAGLCRKSLTREEHNTHARSPSVQPLSHHTNSEEDQPCANLLCDYLHEQRGHVIAAARNISEGTLLFSEPPCFFLQDSTLGIDLHAVYKELRADPIKVEEILQKFQHESNSEFALKVKEKAQPLVSCWAPNELEKLAALVSVLYIHAYEITRNGDTIGQALFERAGKMSHSCQPNCSWYTEWNDKEDSFRHNVRSTVDIKSGDEITVSYLLEEDLIMPTPHRQSILQDHYGFLCSCSRCVSE